MKYVRAYRPQYNEVLSYFRISIQRKSSMKSNDIPPSRAYVCNCSFLAFHCGRSIDRFFSYQKYLVLMYQVCIIQHTIMHLTCGVVGECPRINGSRHIVQHTDHSKNSNSSHSQLQHKLLCNGNTAQQVAELCFGLKCY